MPARSSSRSASDSAILSLGSTRCAKCVQAMNIWHSSSLRIFYTCSVFKKPLPESPRISFLTPVKPSHSAPATTASPALLFIIANFIKGCVVEYNHNSVCGCQYIQQLPPTNRSAISQNDYGSNGAVPPTPAPDTSTGNTPPTTANGQDYVFSDSPYSARLITAEAQSTAGWVVNLPNVSNL